ncbi:hypothetical protein I6E61_00025 [Psychrobacter sp. NZS113]|jgi:hypothetical protein|uniref:hypothetical protein n=1 Tax=Psychrobacter sp. NZS113 TaxID=2792045 RepID=UPI0018CF6A47|nr:hypothetical protein [Psychrobacter sp. NZS113]MBH0094774.1 hypothetical protein [Psychrobacter sp. NZS113]
MQMKHLIIFALVGMVALLGFNLINGSQRDKNREALVSSAASQQSSINTEIPETHIEASSSDAITSKPLGEQPKAILDSATTQIDQAQQAEQKNLEEMDNTAQ